MSFELLPFDQNSQRRSYLLVVLIIGRDATKSHTARKKKQFSKNRVPVVFLSANAQEDSNSRLHGNYA